MEHPTEQHDHPRDPLTLITVDEFNRFLRSKQLVERSNGLTWAEIDRVFAIAAANRSELYEFALSSRKQELFTTHI